MNRRPPGDTHTYTLFPYTTLFRTPSYASSTWGRPRASARSPASPSRFPRSRRRRSPAWRADMNVATPAAKAAKDPAVKAAKDYASDQEVRWCPGCGDYAILQAVQKTLADLEADTANTVVISGIGCAARTPHYLANYAFPTRLGTRRVGKG